MVIEDKSIFLSNSELDVTFLTESKKSNLCPGSWKKYSQRIFQWVLPSFLQSQLSSTSPKPLKLHETSYLDGLRGIASFIVFMGHYTEENIGWFSEPYGLFEDGAASSPFQLPFIRVLYSSRPMVHIFFVISGLVLAFKPLTYIHSQQFLAFENCLSSSVFRRAIRLFLPSFIALILSGLAVGSGISDRRYTNFDGSFLYHFRNVFHVCWKLMGASWAIDVLDNGHPEYNPALWSIPVEFSQSLLLYITILGLSRCTTKVRIGLHSIILWYCFRSGHLFTVEFLAGSLIAELILAQGRSSNKLSDGPVLATFSGAQAEDQSMSKSRRCNIKQNMIHIFWIMNIVCGLFISSWTNEHFAEVWGISFLSRNTPEPYDIRNSAKVWFCLGAIQIVIACTQISWLKNILNMSIPQYLGNISFPLYLTHNLCLTTLEPRIIPILDKVIGKTSFWGRHLFWIAGLLIYFPVIIIISDLFWRMVDIPSVKFAHWLESKSTVKKTS
ncbi:putative hard surface induced protein [Erysiphe neolycopersici]|uniref:Putative hard surface induced protein n=1 Tax=Erysiphe neolycopersici TaxID=212602 RepID=A0A420HYI5_9PEZI|nr:putative hard surface induced protein [Erysiphe neolycopersici]